MATNAPTIPRVADTDLDRDDLRQAAEELGIEVDESLDDQRLFEEIGLRLGEITEEQLRRRTQDDAGEEGAEEAQDSSEEGAEEARDSGEEARDSGEEAGEEAAEEARDSSEEGAEEAQDTDEEARGYRFEDDDRPSVEQVLDLDLGPVALDLLGLEIHLDRVHLAIVANPEPPYALLGKLVAMLAKPANTLGLDTVTDKAADAVNATLDALPSPDLGGDSDEDGDEDEDDESGGVLSTLARPLKGAGRWAKNVASTGGQAASEATEAGRSGMEAVEQAASGHRFRAMKRGSDAVGQAADAVRTTASMAAPTSGS